MTKREKHIKNYIEKREEFFAIVKEAEIEVKAYDDWIAKLQAMSEEDYKREFLEPAARLKHFKL